MSSSSTIWCIHCAWLMKGKYHCPGESCFHANQLKIRSSVEKRKDSFMPGACAPCGIRIHTCSCFGLCADRFYDSCKLRGIGNALQTLSCEVDTIFSKSLLSGIWIKKKKKTFSLGCFFSWQWKLKMPGNTSSFIK